MVACAPATAVSVMFVISGLWYVLVLGAVETALFRTSFETRPDPEAARREIAQRYALRRIAEPEEMAASIVFLSSAASSYVTGTALAADGDLRRHMGRDILDRKARDVMTKSPKVVYADQMAAEALALMNEKKITQLFVLDPKDKTKKPAGILHMHDCLRAGIQ